MSTTNYITAYSIVSKREVYKNSSLLFAGSEGDMNAFLIAAYHHLEIKYPKFYKMDNLSKLGMIASEVLLKPEFDKTMHNPANIGIVLANASSSLDTDIKYFETVSNIASPSLFVYTLPNIVIGEICIRNGFKGENAFFVFNRFDANFIHQYVNNLLTTNVLEVCICGWIELFEDSHAAVLFLVEKKASTGNDPLFTIENINKIYETTNG